MINSNIIILALQIWLEKYTVYTQGKTEDEAATHPSQFYSSIGLRGGSQMLHAHYVSAISGCWL